MPSLRRMPGAAALAVCALAIAAPGALAANLNNAGGTLSYSGADVDNDVTFTQTAPNEVQVVRDVGSDADPIVASGCTQNTAGVDYTCSGVNAVTANGNGGTDFLGGSALTDIPITINGGAGDDTLDGGGAVDTLSGQAGDDGIDGNGGGDTLHGGADMDDLEGLAGNDTLNGEDGEDLLDGGGDDDLLSGGTGGDRMLGGGGTDNLDGGDGPDAMTGDGGNDRVSGEDGDDQLIGSNGSDDYTGGPGFDTAIGPPSTPPRNLNVTLDDVANDQLSGEAGEVDNVHTDVDALESEFRFFVPVPPSGDDTLVGSGGPNSISGDRGNDTIDGNAGNDTLSGGDGNDTFRGRDGYADFIVCGAGTDTAEVDTLDRVQECENVTVADVGNVNDVPEDRPPTIALLAPPLGALLPTTGPTTMTATATDDVGVAQVLFIDDDRTVCADASAPYTCDYRPRGEDVGRNTLVVTAVDTAQQTTSLTRTFRVDRFTPTLTGRVTPARDVRAPFRFRTTGRLRLPTAVPAALGCAEGVVSVQVKAAGKTISTRRAAVRPDCTFSSAVSFATRRRFSRSGRLRFELRFTGNEVLERSAAFARNIRTRR